jgi:hypothetical protein
VIQNLDDGKQTDVLIMDFSKAFDKVSHNLGYTLDLSCKQEQHGQFSSLMGQHLNQEIFEKL